MEAMGWVSAYVTSREGNTATMWCLTESQGVISGEGPTRWTYFGTGVVGPFGVSGCAGTWCDAGKRHSSLGRELRVGHGGRVRVRWVAARLVGLGTTAGPETAGLSGGVHLGECRLPQSPIVGLFVTANLRDGVFCGEGYRLEDMGRGWWRWLERCVRDGFPSGPTREVLRCAESGGLTALDGGMGGVRVGIDRDGTGVRDTGTGRRKGWRGALARPSIPRSTT